MGEEEGDDSIVTEAEEALKALKAESGRLQVEAMLSAKPTATILIWEVHSGAGGYRKPGLGKHAFAHVYPLGGAQRFQW